MPMEQIDLLTTLNEGYLPQLQVMLTSLAVNNPKETFALTLLHSGIPEKKLQGVAKQCVADLPVTHRGPKLTAATGTRSMS